MLIFSQLNGIALSGVWISWIRQSDVMWAIRALGAFSRTARSVIQAYFVVRASPLVKCLHPFQIGLCHLIITLSLIYRHFAAPFIDAAN
jgi:hypothetical protein